MVTRLLKLCFYHFCLDQTAQPIPGIFLFKLFMKRLLEEIQDAFENEDFSDSIFNDVWIDYTLDVIDNKGTQRQRWHYWTHFKS